MAQLPTGTVTFLFTDIEGSTQLLQRLGDAYARALGEHQALLRAAFAAQDGAEVDTQGDAFFVAFPSAPQAVAAAAEATRALAAHAWPEGATLRVRMGLHTGAPQLVGDHYVGLDVHRAARIAAAGHGGQILLSEATRTLVEQALPADATLRAVGIHRLKDLQEPEPLFQLVVAGLPADFPPLKTLDTHHHNLPPQPTPLLGRAEQVAALTTLLARDEVRLVTLTGPGGIGKTRLSLQVAAELVESFPDGVWFVRLSRLTDPALVLPTIAQVFNLKEQGATPVGAVLQSYLREKRLLLVLDNFEQVVGAAPAISDLLAACPGVTALVTSRSPLHLQGEREYTVRPLALPDSAHLPALEQLSQYAAVALFIEQAQAAQVDFTVTNATAPAVAAICARLDGLPLAIVLAAARIKLLPPAALLHRLERSLAILTGGARDLEVRQQTIRATLAWSYELLAPEEQRLFRRLAVFVGGWTLDSAEMVCAAPEGVDPLGLDVLAGLSALVDQSLVQQREEDGEPRFSLLHVIREFALEQLEAQGEAEALRRAHAAYVLTWTADTTSALRAMGDARWLTQLEREHDNIRAAVGWALDRRETALGLRLGVGFAPFWFVRGYYSEGRRWLEELLASGLPANENPSSNEDVNHAPAANALLRAWGLMWVSLIASNQSDPIARKWESEALNAARASGNEEITAITLLFAGLHELRRSQGDTQRGQALLEEALVMSQRLTDMEAVVWVRGNYIRNLVRVEEKRERAKALSEELLALGQRLSYPFIESYAGWNLGEIALLQGDLSTAHARADHALRLAREHGVLVWALNCIEVLGWVADRQGNGVRAARLLGADAGAYERMGTLGWETDITAEIAKAATRAMLGDENWDAAFAAGRTLPLEQAIAEALGEGGETGAAS